MYDKISQINIVCWLVKLFFVNWLNENGLQYLWLLKFRYFIALQRLPERKGNPILCCIVVEKCDELGITDKRMV